jgi:hypothetical protein
MKYTFVCLLFTLLTVSSKPVADDCPMQLHKYMQKASNMLHQMVKTGDLDVGNLDLDELKVYWEMAKMMIISRYGDYISWDKLREVNLTSIAKDARRASTRFHDGFLEDVKRRSTPPIEKFCFTPIFRSPDDVNDLWVPEIAIASSHIVRGLDQVNFFLNGGVLSEKIINDRYRNREAIMVLEMLSRVYHELVKVARTFDKQPLIDFLQNEFPADCVYDLLAEKSKDISIFNMFLNHVSKEQFKDYTSRFSDAAVVLLKSAHTEADVKQLVSIVIAQLNKVDTDSLTLDIYRALLNARSLVLKVDVKKVFSNLNELMQTMQYGLWKMYTGQWPEMVEFVSNFYLHTFGSDRFWWKLDRVYHDILDWIEAYYQKRQQRMEDALKEGLLPFLGEVLNIMEHISRGESEVVKMIMDYVKDLGLDALIQKYMPKLAELVSREFLSCYTELWGKPDFEMMKKIIAGWDNPVVRMIKDVVAGDWPTFTLPAGLGGFAEKVQDAILLIFTSCLGTCRDPMHA